MSGLPRYLVFQHFGDINPDSLFITPGSHDLPGQVLLRCRFKTDFGLIYPTHVLSFKWIHQGSSKDWTCNCASWRFFLSSGTHGCKYEWNLPSNLDIACLWLIWIDCMIVWKNDTQSWWCNGNSLHHGFPNVRAPSAQWKVLNSRASAIEVSSRWRFVMDLPSWQIWIYIRMISFRPLAHL